MVYTSAMMGAVASIGSTETIHVMPRTRTLVAKRTAAQMPK